MNIYNLTQKFNTSDVVLNEDRLLEEVNGIYHNEYTRRNRSFETIYNMTKQGHILEQFLIDNHGFTNIDEKYLDLMSPDGITIDCKTVKKHLFTTTYLNKIIEDIKRKNTSYGCNIKYIVVYLVQNTTYEYYGTIEI